MHKTTPFFVLQTRNLLVLWFVFFFGFSSAQDLFSAPQNPRAELNSNRLWWDVQHYALEIEVLVDQRKIVGKNTISYAVLPGVENTGIMQIDLQTPMEITKITDGEGNSLKFTQEPDSYLVEVKNVSKDSKLVVYFQGIPKVAPKAPWEGGFTWARDRTGATFVSTSCQGEGSSLWWPGKDHPTDEPQNGMTLKITTPSNLVGVSNGQLIQREEGEKKSSYTWQVKSPINLYNISLNAGRYQNWKQKYNGLNGELDLSYYVIAEDLDKSVTHFSDVKKTLDAFEYWFGPYPFYQDGFKLIQTPFLGMEHQSGIAYGNHFLKGYLGGDISGTGLGMLFDYIIVHETAHEWWGNSVSVKDVADLWVHEAFACYSEALFVSYHLDAKSGEDYILGLRENIRNDAPIIGKYGLGIEGSSDMYSKGANLLHMISKYHTQESWRQTLMGIQKEFYQQTVTGKQIEDYLKQKTPKADLSLIFDQYLRSEKIPILDIQKTKSGIKYQLKNCNESLVMPISLIFEKGMTPVWITASTQTAELSLDKTKLKSLKVDPGFYLNVKIR
ncbi:MAG: peptidase M1 [Flavobacteriaceae bacterium]|nr:MAG: peptidase M1 [Flavobacteriaceae bacterium]